MKKNWFQMILAPWRDGKSLLMKTPLLQSNQTKQRRDSLSYYPSSSSPTIHSSSYLTLMAHQSPRSLKRKLEQDFTEQDQENCKVIRLGSPRELPAFILKRLALVNSVFSSSDTDRGAASIALHVLCELAKNEETVDTLVNCGAVTAMMKLLQTPSAVSADADSDTDGVKCGYSDSYKYDMQKLIAFILGLLAIKPEYQQLIADAGALPYLVALLRNHNNNSTSKALSGLLRRVADSITSLAHENTSIKSFVRTEGGIPPLVELLEFNDTKVQRAAAAALRTIAFKNDANKKEIVACNALPTIVVMLHSEDPLIHYEAIGVIGNLVHSSPDIKKEVLLAGALQPVICLLSSSCLETKREAALLLGQFATTDSDCKLHIAQRGAIKPLVDMLKSTDTHLKEMSTFALGRLAQDVHNQGGIAYNGGIEPLLELLDSKNGRIQHNAAFSLYGLADTEDNVAGIIKVGGFQKLLDGKFKVQPTKECVGKTLKRLEEKIHGRVLKHLLYLMRFAEKSVQRHIALALAHLCSPNDRKIIFIENNGLELLLELLESTNLKQKGDASTALHKLATKATSVSLHAAPLSPTHQVYMGAQYVNNPKLSDVTFIVEGRSFYAHRACLLSSEIFRAMFDGGYREKEAKDIEIPNIKWDVFELMMRFIYTGTIDVDSEIAPYLLKAADQYLLDDLKRLCEYTISQDISVENILLMYEMSESFNATSLRNASILFVLEQFDKLTAKPWYYHLVRCILPEIRKFFSTLLTKPHSADS